MSSHLITKGRDVGPKNSTLFLDMKGGGGERKVRGNRWSQTAGEVGKGFRRVPSWVVQNRQV